MDIYDICNAIAKEHGIDDLTDYDDFEEILTLIDECGLTEQMKNCLLEEDLIIGNMVKIISGPFEGIQGIVKSFGKTVTVLVDLFGQETSIEVGLTEIETLII